MTISTTTNKLYHNGNGSAVDFSFPYPVLSDSHLFVYVNADGAGYVLRTLNGVGTYDYTLTGVGTPSSCMVKFNTAPPSVTKGVFLLRVVPLTQISDYVNGDEFPMEVLEKDLDKAFMGLQQLEERIARCFIIPRPSDTYSAALPGPTPSALLAAKADGTGFEWVSPTTFGAANVSAFMLTLLDDASATAALATLGAASTITPYLIRPISQAPWEAWNSLATSGAITIDCNTAAYFYLNIIGNVTSITINNVPALYLFSLTIEIRQGGTGSYTIAWPGTVKWEGGVAPTLTTTVGKTDVVTLVTRDGGTSWLGFVAGKNM